MRHSERGFTLVEIMIVVAIIALLAAIAIPNVLRGRATANETAAVGNMRALLSSLEMYRSVNSAYPTTWASMTTANPAFYPQPFSGTAAGLAQTVQGYTYAYTGAQNTYSITAVPANATSGGRQFLINESGRVFHCSSTSATPGVSSTDPSIDSPPSSACP